MLPAGPRPRSLAVVLITDDEHGAASALAGLLEGAGIPAVVVSCARDGTQNGKYPRIDLTDPKAVEEFVEHTRSRGGKIQAIVHLMPLHDARMVEDSSSALRVETGAISFFNLLQKCEADLRASGGRVLTATRLGGAFGEANPSGEHAWSGQGAACGMVKTVAREWPEVTSRAVDFSLDT